MPKKSLKGSRYTEAAKATALANLEEPRSELTAALPQEPIILSPVHAWQLGYDQRQRRKRMVEKNLHTTEAVIDPERDPRWRKRGEE